MTVKEVLSEKEDIIMGKGVSATEIEEAEEALNLKFSDDYKEYLSSVGLLMCNGHELTGLGKSDRTNVVDVTKQMKKVISSIPDDWYVIENENMDGAVMWQDSQGIVYFNRTKEYTSFLEFLQDL